MIRSTNLLFLLLLLLPFAVAGCGGGGGYEAPAPFVGEIPDDTPSDPHDPPPTPPPPPPTPPTPPGSTTSQPRVPLGSTPPKGLTWFVGYTENATLAQLQSRYEQVQRMLGAASLRQAAIGPDSARAARDSTQPAAGVGGR